MKKLASILISVVYLLLSMGVVINAHYCQSRLISISIISTPEPCCEPSDLMDNHCCTNKQYIVQMDSQDQIIPAAPDLSKTFDFVLSETFNFELPEFSEPQTKNFSYDLPPPKRDIWKMNCTFLFYG